MVKISQRIFSVECPHGIVSDRRKDWVKQLLDLLLPLARQVKTSRRRIASNTNTNRESPTCQHYWLCVCCHNNQIFQLTIISKLLSIHLWSLKCLAWTLLYELYGRVQIFSYFNCFHFHNNQMFVLINKKVAYIISFFAIYPPVKF